jgi:hypothetical protein
MSPTFDDDRVSTRQAVLYYLAILIIPAEVLLSIILKHRVFGYARMVDIGIALTMLGLSLVWLVTTVRSGQRPLKRQLSKRAAIILMLVNISWISTLMLLH